MNPQHSLEEFCNSNQIPGITDPIDNHISIPATNLWQNLINIFFRLCREELHSTFIGHKPFIITLMIMNSIGDLLANPRTERCTEQRVHIIHASKQSTPFEL